MVADYAVVFVVALLVGGFSIPVGLLLDVDPWGVYLAATAGSLLYMVAFLAGGGWVRQRFFRTTVSEMEARVEESRAQRLLDRWGVAGLAVIGGVVLGPSITLLAALALGVDRARFTWWYTLSTVVGFFLLTMLWNWVL